MRIWCHGSREGVRLGPARHSSVCPARAQTAIPLGQDGPPWSYGEYVANGVSFDRGEKKPHFDNYNDPADINCRHCDSGTHPLRLRTTGSTKPRRLLDISEGRARPAKTQRRTSAHRQMSTLR